MNLTIALSVVAIVCGLANITFITVYLCRGAWRDTWKWRYKSFWHSRYLRKRARQRRHA